MEREIIIGSDNCSRVSIEHNSTECEFEIGFFEDAVRTIGYNEAIRVIEFLSQHLCGSIKTEIKNNNKDEPVKLVSNGIHKRIFGSNDD